MKVRDWPVFLPLTRPIQMRKIVKAVQLLHDVLADSPIHGKYWLCGGLVLGYVRQGGMLPHDMDIDFHYWRSDREKLETSLDLLLKSGFKIHACWKNNSGEITEYALKYKTVIKFDFLEVNRVNNKMQWYCYGGGPIIQQIRYAVPVHDLEKIELYEREWLKPADHELYLTSMYGDWRTPNPKYRFYEDCQAIIEKTVWTGTKSTTI